MNNPGRPLCWLLPAVVFAFVGAARADLYFPCRSCHGDEGLGSPAINAPPIAGQSAAYIARQLANFRDGIRGAAAADTWGRQMALMAYGLDDASIDELASAVASMPPRPGPGGAASIEGSEIYQPCIACHGARGEGNTALLAPRISGMDARYLARQLRHFRDGLRGADPDDTPGRTMRAALPPSIDNATIEKISRYVEAL
jgi:cytochrome c553